MARTDNYDHYSDGGYDVVSWRPNPAALSLFCAAFPFLLGIMIDELPFVAPAWIRRHLSNLVFAGLGSAALGVYFGGMAMRRPASRGLGRFGLAVNLIILLLLSLFVLAFRWITGR